MATYESEQDFEALKKWWQENGTSIIIGILLGFTLLFGWRGWEYYTNQRAEFASNLYETILLTLEQGQADKAREVANTLLSEYSKSSYASLAQLNLATQDLKEGNINSTHARLQWIIEQNVLPQLTHIARLRQVKLFLSEAKREEAKKLLGGVADYGKFKSGYTELKGDLAVSQGQLDVARKMYAEVLANSELLSSEQKDLVQTKLDHLGTETRIEAPVPVLVPPPPVEVTATPSTAASAPSLQIPMGTSTAQPNPAASIKPVQDPAPPSNSHTK